MKIDLKNIVFGALLGGVLIASVLSYLAPKSEVDRFERLEWGNGGECIFDTQTGEMWQS